MTSGRNVYDELNLLRDLFLTLEVNDIDDQCFEFEAEEVHQIAERILTVLEQHYDVLHIFGEVIEELDWEVNNNDVQEDIKEALK